MAEHFLKLDNFVTEFLFRQAKTILSGQDQGPKQCPVTDLDLRPLQAWWNI